MSDLFRNHIVGFSTRWLIYFSVFVVYEKDECFSYGPSREKTNNVVSEQV